MMRRLLLAACALAASGCFFSLGNPLSFVEGERPLSEQTVEGEGRAKILLLDIADVITDVPTKRAFGLVEEESTVARVHAELDKAGDDERVAAIVLRINSPGGGVTASDDIYADIMRFKQEHNLPVIAALGNIAASGGYYVACAADRIVAHPTTVTGSIGVIMVGLNVEGLLGKIGVKPQTFKAGEHKDLLSPFRGATAEERRIVQGIIDSMHARFIGIVKESRLQLDAKRLGELTDGRIFDAARALDAGLVDQVGDLRAAIETAKAAAKVEKARVVMYRRSGETAETIYSTARGRPLQVNLLPIDLGMLAANGPRFMYLWAPGLSSGLFSGPGD
jgi:protease IV